MKRQFSRHNALLILLCLLCLRCFTPAAAQDTTPSLTEKPKKTDGFRQRLSVGGNLGIQFGSVTGINVAPEVAVRTLDHLHVGLRAIYEYYRYKDYYLNTQTNETESYRASVYGAGLFLRYYLYSLFDSFLGNLFAHAEYEYLYYTRPYEPCVSGIYLDPYGNRFKAGKDAINVHSIFVGGGYRQPVGNRVYFDLLVLFNLNDSYNSPYSNPMVRLGVAVGL